MKKVLLFIAAIACVSCGKNLETECTVSESEKGEIVLNVTGSGNFEAGTRTTAIIDVPSSLYWSATSGSLQSSETSRWPSASASVSSGRIATGKYLAETPSAYNYYVANLPIVFDAKGSTLTVNDSGTDVIAGCTAKADNSASPSVVLSHIFSRLGTVSIKAPDNYKAKDLKLTIVPKRKGIYNVASGIWTGRNRTDNVSVTLHSGSTTPSTAAEIAAGATVTASATDTYCVPGADTLILNYKLSRGDWEKSYTKKAYINLTKGNINNIVAVIPDGEATQIQVSVTLTAWGSNTINVNSGSGSVVWNN